MKLISINEHSLVARMPRQQSITNNCVLPFQPITNGCEPPEAPYFSRSLLRKFTFLCPLFVLHISMQSSFLISVNTSGGWFHEPIIIPHRLSYPGYFEYFDRLYSSDPPYPASDWLNWHLIDTYSNQSHSSCLNLTKPINRGNND